jgi:hypothetical protein
MTILPEVQQAPDVLSLQQQFLCLLDQGDGAGPFGSQYVLVDGWRLRGRVDVEAMRLALADVVERHEAPRTQINRADGSGTQSVLPAKRPELLVLDLHEPPGADRDRRAEQLINETEARPFPVDSLPLLRAVLGRFDDEDSVLVLATHHSASDAWSIQVVMRDLADSYAARAAGREPHLAEAVQYRDYTAAQRQEATGPAVAASRAYWRENLRGARILVAPKRRDEQVTPATTWHRFLTEPDLRAGLSKLASETRSSPFMVLLAAFTVFIHRRTGATDIVVPTFAPGRRHQRFQATVGSFVNFVPLRTDLEGCRTFRDVAERARKASLGAFAHELPLLHVLAEAPELMSSAGPDAAPCLFQVIQPPYMMLGEKIGELEYTAIWRRVISQPLGSDIPDGMLWSMHLGETEVLGALGYSRHLFDHAQVDEQVADYLAVLGEMVADLDAPIAGS